MAGRVRNRTRTRTRADLVGGHAVRTRGRTATAPRRTGPGRRRTALLVGAGTNVTWPGIGAPTEPLARRAPAGDRSRPGRSRRQPRAHQRRAHDVETRHPAPTDEPRPPRHALTRTS